jgi:hypothetical protein
MQLAVLVMIAAPKDAPQFDAEQSWRDLSHALEPLIEQRLVALSRCTPATEVELKRNLAQHPFHVLHFIGHGRSRQAQYGTLLFENSERATRAVNAQYLAGLLQKTPVKLAVLQAALEEDGSFTQSADAFAGQSLAALVTPRLDAKLAALVARVFYARLASGGSAEQALADVREALEARGGSAHASRFSLRGTWQPVSAPPAAAPAAATPQPTAPTIPPAEQLAKRELERKRAAGSFDIFLCHNWADKPAVKKIAQALKTRGILPWLDEWELPPGQPWQPLLEQQIAGIKAAAVCVGAAGIGPWQEQELNGFLREFVARKCPVIPVLLFDAPEKPELPIFLRAMTWVDFRITDPDPLERLIWGITGKRAAEN